MLRTRGSIVLALLLSASLLTGCFGKDDAPEPVPTPTPTPTLTPTPPPTVPDVPPPPPRPDDVVVEDSGEIRGPFEKSWTLSINQVGWTSTQILFNLTGLQAGTPPTARVFLSFNDPSGASIKSAVVGLSSDRLAWSFTQGELLETGDYTIVATAEPTDSGTGIPSLGAGSYALFALVDY